MLTSNALKLVYYSLVYPYLTYCHTLWGTAGTSKTKQIVIAQKKIIRILGRLRRDDHTNPIFSNMSILKFDDINIYCTAIFVFKALKNPFIVNFDFRYRLNDRYVLRNSNLLEVPLVRSSQSQSFVHSRGVEVWNHLPDRIKAITSLQSFKAALKQHLIMNY